MLFAAAVERQPDADTEEKVQKSQMKSSSRSSSGCWQ